MMVWKKSGRPRRSAGRYTTSMLTLLAVPILAFVVLAVGFAWRQSGEITRTDYLREYHLVSARSADTIERNVALLASQAELKEQLYRHDPSKLASHDDGTRELRIHEIQNMLELLVSREEAYGEHAAGRILDRIVKSHEGFLVILNKLDSLDDLSVQRVHEAARQYQLKATQLSRLHRMRFEDRSAEYLTARYRADVALLFLFVGVLLSGGVITVWLFGKIATSDARLRDSRALVLAVANNVPGGVFRCQVRPGGAIKVLYASDGFEHVASVNPGNADDGFWDVAIEMVHPDEQASLMDQIKRCNRSCEDLAIDFRVLGKDGQWVWRRVLASIEVVEDGVHLWTGLMLDVTEEKEAEVTLKQAREIAEGANKSKSRFLASMSHEIRTPMNAVLGFAQILETGTDRKLSERQKECVHQIMTGGRHLLSLIDDVLDLSRIESGKADVTLTPVDPRSLVAECLTLVQGLAEKNRIEILEPVIVPEVQGVLADRTRLRQVVLNLVSNAVKYNRTGGSVALHVFPASPETVRFEVVDTGEGMAPELMEELFQPFSRLGREALSIEGTGIGLVISKTLIEQMGGVIGCESEAGIGSTFWIEIPKAQEMTLVPRPVKDPGEKTAVDTLGGKTILYIEDNLPNITLVRTLLQGRFDGSIITARNGKAGLAMARQFSPDLILLDLNLPGMDGYQVMEELRSKEQTRSCPVIAVTALAMDEDVKRGEQSGFTDYITKPFDIDEMYEKIHTALQSEVAVNQ